MSPDTGAAAEDGGEWDADDIEATLVYDAYLAEVRAGRPPDAERLLAEHPTLASRLRALVEAEGLMSELAGDVVPELEDYRIIRVLGRGGMGVVYEAEQVSRNRRVAVKVLTAAAAMDPQQLKRFLQVEVPAARLLRHPHIVPIVDFGCERGTYFYAMRYIDGLNLSQWVKSVADFDATEPDVGRRDGETTPLAVADAPPDSAPTCPPIGSERRRVGECRRRRRSTSRIGKGWSIATSSPRTCCSTAGATCGSPISAWPASRVEPS